jgi:CCR4-NOT complex subunit CAF16
MDTWQVLLMDEITVDLDVVARMDLLSFFVDECEEVSHRLTYHFRFPR